MRVVDFVFSLIEKFVPIPNQEREELKGEIMVKYQKVIINKDSTDYEDTLATKAKTILENPWTRLGFAIGFIPVCRWVVSFMNSKPEDELKED